MNEEEGKEAVFYFLFTFIFLSSTKAILNFSRVSQKILLFATFKMLLPRQKLMLHSYCDKTLCCINVATNFRVVDYFF